MGTLTPSVHFCTFGRNECPTPRVVAGAGWEQGEITVIGKWYFLRQAATLVEFAQSTNNPKLAAALIKKAADLLAQIDESDAGPDVEPENRA